MILIIVSSAILLFINIFYIDFRLGAFYYLIFLIFFISSLILDSNRQVRLNKKYMFFHFVLMLNIGIIEIPDIFSSELRYCAFFIMSTFLGPFVRSEAFDKIRLNLLSVILRLSVIITFSSLLFILLGIDTRPPLRPDYNGLFNHSMVFGPFAGISVVYLLNKFTVSNMTILKRILFLLLLLCCLASVIISGSRVAMLSMFGALFCYIGMNYAFFLVRNLKSFLLLIGLFVFSFPLWSDKTENLLNKLEYAENENDFTASRTLLWMDRWEEFKASPFIGIGFASVGVKKLSILDNENGKIEPGSSWLAVLSMTGFLGFIAFLWLLPIGGFFKRNKSQNEKLFFSLLFFFLIHMLAEGYIFSAGSGLFFIFWLLLGVINVSINYEKI